MNASTPIIVKAPGLEVLKAVLAQHEREERRMATPASETVKDRLRRVVSNRPPKGRHRGIRLFQREMEQRRDELRADGQDLVGVSLPTIHGYVSPDGPTPTDDFVHEAASVLGVSPEWLLKGEGGQRTDGIPTPEEAHMDHIGRIAAALERIADALEKRAAPAPEPEPEQPHPAPKYFGAE